MHSVKHELLHLCLLRQTTPHGRWAVPIHMVTSGSPLFMQSSGSLRIQKAIEFKHSAGTTTENLDGQLQPGLTNTTLSGRTALKGHSDKLSYIADSIYVRNWAATGVARILNLSPTSAGPKNTNPTGKIYANAAMTETPDSRDSETPGAGEQLHI